MQGKRSYRAKNKTRLVKAKLSIPAMLLFLVAFQSCFKEEKQTVSADFSVSVDHNKYTVPVRITLDNKSTGAASYLWTFEGGTPASSNKRIPDAVVYHTPGTYTIRLEAWNDDERKSKELTLKVNPTVTPAFDVEVPVNNISPVQAVVTNTSTGGETYAWTFEGGTPASSSSYTPPAVTFTEAGEHVITLEIFNGSETVTHSKTITVLPAMELDFAITPSFEDEDMEAPLTATLANLSSNGLAYRWTSTAGTIADNAASEATTIYFADEGAHTITLEADNGKEVKSISKTITVKANSNLYAMQNVKLGIKSAHASIGSFYSCALRKVIAKDEVNTDNGPLIDFAFFGINETFSYCLVASPDLVGGYAFYDIPGATHTAVVNTPESTTLSFTAADFDAMVNDTPLKPLDINANDTGSLYFTGSVAPRIVLFETADGRKGAVKITSFVADGQQSYILADIKVQKEKVE